MNHRPVNVLFIFAFCAFVLVPHSSFSQVFGTPIYEWSFASGIPTGWENESEDGISEWEYRGPNTTPSNDVGSRGSCASSSVPLASETLLDGFLIFDSNYWDDDGPACGGNIGGGPAPGPHVAWLTTSSFSLAEAPEATLTFQQQYNHYLSGGTTSTTKVLISINGGDFELLLDNSADGISNSGNVEWVSIPLTDIAGGEADVRLRFEFSGFYYWWMIDNVVIFEPSENDLTLFSANYSTFVENLENNFFDQEYNFYPLNMLPEMEFSARGQNIGGLAQSNTKLSVEVNRGLDNVLSANSPEENLSPGQNNLWQLMPWTPPAVTGKYTIDFELQQDQVDQTPANNAASKDFNITEHTLGLDEGEMEDQFFPNAGYENSSYRIGNVFVVEEPNLRLHNVAVAFGDSSIVGTQVRAQVYYFNNDSIVYGGSEDYEINAFDLNGIGDNFMVHIPLIEPITLVEDTNYFVTVECNTDEGERMVVGRSGDAIPFTSFVNYELNNFGGYMLKYPMVRMELFSANEVPGCTNPLAFNFDPNADTDDESCRFAGCTDPENNNYDPAANWEDGSCFLVGCFDESADNYNPEAEQEGPCLYAGCTDIDATNFDPEANLDDGSCFREGCLDPEADNYDPLADTPGACVFLGCTDPNAINFDPNANTNDESCFYNGAAFTANSSTVCLPNQLVLYNQTSLDPEANCVWRLDGEVVSTDCVDSLVIDLIQPGNYNISYTYNLDGFETNFELNDIVASPSPESVEIEINSITFELSCTNCQADNELAWYLNGELLNNEDNSIFPVASGNYGLQQINSLGCGGALSNLEVNLPQGCLDENATNYDAAALEDDGTCFYESAEFAVSSNTVCVGEILTAFNSTNVNPEATCSWLVNGELYLEDCAENIEFVFDLPGNYSIEYVYSLFGFESSFLIDNIEVLESPEQPVILFDELSSTVFCVDCGGDSYQWQLNGNNIPGADEVVYAPMENGSYSLIVIGENACPRSSEELNVIINNIAEEKQTIFRLYPNPSNTYTWVESSENIQVITLRDAQGKFIDAWDVNSTTFEIDTQKLASGLYFIDLQLEDQLEQLKLLVRP
jgi:hypothetical protein